MTKESCRVGIFSRIVSSFCLSPVCYDRYKKRLLKAAQSRPLFLLILFVIHLPSALVFIAVTAKVSLSKWFNFSEILANASIFSTWSVDMLYG